MHKKTTFGAMGIAMLLVLGMSVLPSGSADEQRVNLSLEEQMAEGCALTLPADECTSASFSYLGEAPALDAADTAAAVGSFTVRIQELPPFTENFWVETTFTVAVVGGEVTVLEETSDQGSSTPGFGWPVEVVGTSNGVAAPAITATAA